jgi:hypothetical protein
LGLPALPGQVLFILRISESAFLKYGCSGVDLKSNFISTQALSAFFLFSFEACESYMSPAHRAFV